MDEPWRSSRVKVKNTIFAEEFHSDHKVRKWVK